MMLIFCPRSKWYPFYDNCPMLFHSKLKFHYQELKDKTANGEKMLKECRNEM